MLRLDGCWLMVHRPQSIVRKNYRLLAIDQETKRPRNQNGTTSAKHMSNSRYLTTFTFRVIDPCLESMDRK